MIKMRRHVFYVMLYNLLIVCLLSVGPFHGIANAQKSKTDLALASAVVNKNSTQARELLSRGANPNLKDVNLLGVASGNEDEVTVKTLLAHGALVNMRDNRGQTALHRAALYNLSNSDLNDFTSQGDISQHCLLLDVMLVLLTHGANVNAKDYEGRTPLMLVAAYAQSPGCTKLLLRFGASVQLKDKHGWSALRYALWGAEHSDNPYKVNANVISLLEHAGQKPLALKRQNRLRK